MGVCITHKWSCLLLCYVFNIASPCTRCTSSALSFLPSLSLSMSFAFSTHTLSRRCSMYCFHPPGCPTYGNNTLYSQWKYCGWIFALLTSGCTVTSWLPLCFMCEITAPWDCTEKKPITQQMSTFSSEMVRLFFFFFLSPLLYFSPVLLLQCWETERG